ncbi:MAG: RHS repeat-associated core domain-containing protein [Bacteroidota bacterium]
MYYIHKDNLGSFDKVSNSSGAVVDSYSFDAWGNRRSTSDWTAAETGITHLFSRGFTGHEHLDAFGLINMNGRCYDPLLGRILSPDPELQDPANIQNYNRYSYCLNNPLKYTDPSGYYIYGHTQTTFSLPSCNHVAQFYDNAGDFMDNLQARLDFEQDNLYAMIAQGTGNGNNTEDKSNTQVNTPPSSDCNDGDGEEPKNYTTYYSMFFAISTSSSSLQMMTAIFSNNNENYVIKYSTLFTDDASITAGEIGSVLKGVGWSCLALNAYNDFNKALTTGSSSDYEMATANVIIGAALIYASGGTALMVGFIYFAITQPANCPGSSGNFDPGILQNDNTRYQTPQWIYHLNY